jgi:hypothetical protein
MGVLAGTRIWRHSTCDAARALTVEALNNHTLDGIVMTDKVGACGHNLIGANVMIFIGSLYSKAYLDQAIGDPTLGGANYAGRMCREGQRRDLKAVIIADKNFPGDSEAFKIKERKGREETWLRLPFKAIDSATVEDAWERVEGLEGDAYSFNKWKRKLREKERMRKLEQKREAERRQMKVRGSSDAFMARVRESRERSSTNLS